MNFIGNFTEVEKDYVRKNIDKINLENDKEGLFVGDIIFMVIKNDDGTMDIKKMMAL